MELKSLFIYSIFLSIIKYLLLYTLLIFIPNTRTIVKLVGLTFSTLVLIVNFHLVSSVLFIDVFWTKIVSTSDLLLQCRIPFDPQLMEALLVFVFSDFLGHLFQLINHFPRRNSDLLKHLLFTFFFVEGFLIKQVRIVLFLGTIQNLVSILKYFFCQFSRSQKGIMIRINLIFLVSFWLWSFFRVIPFHSFYQILALQCDDVADYRLRIFKLVYFTYYILEMYSNPIAEYRRFLEKEFFNVAKVLKMDSFLKKDVKSNVPELDDSKTKAKTYPKRSSENAKNQVMMMQMIRCVMSLKKKAKRIKERKKSEDNKNDLNPTMEIQH